jgi:hypothetical protein
MSTTTTPQGRDWLEMAPAHFDRTLLPRKHRKPDPDAMFTVADLMPQAAPDASLPDADDDTLF